MANNEESSYEEFICGKCSAACIEEYIVCDECRTAYHAKCIAIDDAAKDQEWFCDKCANATKEQSTSTPTVNRQPADNTMMEISRIFEQMKTCMESGVRQKSAPPQKTCYACNIPGDTDMIECNGCNRYVHLTCLTGRSHGDGGILLRYVPVTLHGPGGRTLNTTALLDEGSTVTLMEHRLVKELGVEGSAKPLCLSWTGGQAQQRVVEYGLGASYAE
uniref:PHD-type domain-containing protein n=1 Tax=Anopheles merus TaxID=30066 RepID=A0A182V8M1_ANOME